MESVPWDFIPHGQLVRKITKKVSQQCKVLVTKHMSRLSKPIKHLGVLTPEAWKIPEGDLQRGGKIPLPLKNPRANNHHNTQQQKTPQLQYFTNTTQTKQLIFN